MLFDVGLLVLSLRVTTFLLELVLVAIPALRVRILWQRILIESEVQIWLCDIKIGWLFEFDPIQNVGLLWYYCGAKQGLKIVTK